MNKIKNMNEFENILEYFYYLKDSLDDLNQKKNRAVSSDSKKFYQEQIDIIMKYRSSIRDVVLTKKEQIVHDKLNNIRDEQIKKFITAKKEEKERISKEKVDLELEIELYNSVMDLDNNFFAPIAKYANEYDCSDFFVSDENYNKSYLVKNNSNELVELSGSQILSNYLDDDIVNKLSNRHSLKNTFFANYADNLKTQYPNYSEDEIKSLTNNNLISHSPEFLEKLDNEYTFSTEDYDKLAKAYTNFKEDYNYLGHENFEKKKERLEILTNEFNSLSKIPDGTDLEKYLLNKFEAYDKKMNFIKSYSEIKENDLKVSKYINKNNFLKGIELAPNTKLDYAEKLSTQFSLLAHIKNEELKIGKQLEKIQTLEEHINTLNHSKADIANIYTTENVINTVAELAQNYHNNFVLPLRKLQKEYENYKNTQELGLVPYQKVGFFQRLAGFFNGRNKLQAEFDSKCQNYDSRLYVLTQKANMNKPNYSFDNEHPLTQTIGASIKDYLSSHPDTSDIDATTEVLKKYRLDLHNDIVLFKNSYKDFIVNLDKCSSYNDISNCVLDEISKAEKELDAQKDIHRNIITSKSEFCDKYNENSSRPIAPVATALHLDTISKEMEKQLNKILTYKGENLDVLEYKMGIEKILEKDNSFISNEEIEELSASAHKKVEAILNHAVNSLDNNDKIVKKFISNDMVS